MMNMAGCEDYKKLCGVNGTVVADCKIKIIPLPSESQLNSDITGICNDMDMVACSQCRNSNGKPKSCNLLDVYSDLCMVMPSMYQCGIWNQFCTIIPEWSICDAANNNVPRMEMFFHVGIADYILFQSWVPKNEWQYALSWLAIFFLATLGEGFKVFKTNVEDGLKGNALKVNEETHLHSKHHHKSKPNWKFETELLKSLMRLLDVFIHYILMLVAMTFNVGLFLAVIFGIGVGSFAWSKYRHGNVAEVEEDCH